MTSARIRKVLAAGAAAIALAAVATAGARVSRELVAPEQPAVEVSPSIVGLRAGRAYAYLVRTGGGALLVDTGSDPSGAELLAGLRARGLAAESVTDILLTSAHPDHAAALAVFPNAAVWVGEHDAPLLRRDRLPRAPLTRVVARLSHGPQRQVIPKLVRAGMRLEVAGTVFDAAHLPCVTPGSMAYVHDGVAFTGTALRVTANAVAPPSWLVADAPALCRRAAPRLAQWPVRAIAARDGVLTHADALTAWVGTGAPR